MKLAKTQNGTPDLEKIKLNGTAFETDSDRDEHITNFYSTLYGKPNPEPVLDDNSINNFLGEAANNANVTASKLSEPEKILLDSPLELRESRYSNKTV
jgi:hypothetical protein